jgi:NADP-dependent 3-hydroxy acid dehydrogenase YdfG
MPGTALITGAGGGIGAAIAEALAPTHTLLLAGRPSARLDSVAERLGATTWPMDLTDPDGIEAAAEVLAELDVLVHNAGVSFPGRVAESTPEQWRATFEVNVTGAVALTCALLPALRAARGQVIFINSGAGMNASPGLASYSASKFALRAFADSLRTDEPLLRVTSIHPGRVDTEMQRDLVAYEGRDYNPADFLTPHTVAGVVATVVATPADAHTHEVVIRPRGPH